MIPMLPITRAVHSRSRAGLYHTVTITAYAHDSLICSCEDWHYRTSRTPDLFCRHATQVLLDLLREIDEDAPRAAQTLEEQPAWLRQLVGPSERVEW